MLKKIDLANTIKNSKDEILKMLTSLESKKFNDGEEVIPGIYITGTSSHYFFQDDIIESWESFCVDDNYEENYRSNFGICDNYEQILKEYPELQEYTDRNFVVLMTPIYKDEQEPRGGWRWHKWGEYIGDKKPTHEYLYDEPDIEMVYVYHIYEVV